MTIAALNSDSTTDARVNPAKFLWLFAMALLLIGGVSRVAPLFNAGGRIQKQWPIEDGYMLLTVARNLGIGQGMSTAAGTMPTNGVQPLVTFIFAACYKLAGGDKLTGLLYCQIVEVALSIACAVMIYLLGKQILGRLAAGRLMAVLGAAAWFASPILTKHSMNCLETSLYILSITVCLYFYSRWIAPPEAGGWIVKSLGMGFMLGLAFWSRNDAIFFIFAMCLVTGILGLLRPAMFKRRLAQVMIMGLTSALVALPWLVFNKTHFGSIMPISGHAEWGRYESLKSGFYAAPLMIAEYGFLLFQRPAAWTPNLPAVLAALAAVGSIVFMFMRVWRHADQNTRPMLGVFAVFAIVACGFYTTVFLVEHFQSRYMAPISTVLAVVWGFSVVTLLNLPVFARRRWLVGVCGLLMLIAPAGSQLRLYIKGNEHMHFRVVEYVQNNIPDSAWVGAIQSGTLGYYHDRTINLDGKVNPGPRVFAKTKTYPGSDALPYYILRETPIEYLADWDIAKFVNLPGYQGHFVVVVDDVKNPSGRLTVIKRITPLPEEHAAQQ